MLRFIRTRNFPGRFLVLLFLPTFAKLEDEYCRPEDATNMAVSFRLLQKDACSVPKTSRISEATYSLSSSCAQKCLQEPFCVGYNFKNMLKKTNSNCQLAHALNYNMSNCNIDDEGWVFYHLLGQRKVPCSKMKNCKNGGKTVIDLNDGPGSDPYKCRCEGKYKGNLCEYATDLFSESTILSGILHLYQNLLQTWIGRSYNTLLCWRASRDGWAAATFHARCDHKKPTVTFIKVGVYIFGFYVTESWDGSSYKQAPGSFIFSLRNKENLAPFKAPLKNENDGAAMHATSTYGPTVGNGHDVHIANNAHYNTGSYTYFGHAYNYESKHSILAGTYHFTPSEVEVFHLV
ncbi:uncharacterized protein LOC114539001 [Dendronephthya gigantea]|uniref:uncharacterized protein LOC114539001 n=1 Tax=Dendronephthya gigantea TaxID=151771 RepID=UPI00106A2B56|nr:uncharacterized protein LOC114539001 [Dendronephthya gigantea]